MQLFTLELAERKAGQGPPSINCLVRSEVMAECCSMRSRQSSA